MKLGLKKKRPMKLHSKTIQRVSPAGSVFLTIGEDQDGQPFEVFVNIGKRGSEVYAAGEAMGRLISLLLRMQELGTPAERLQLAADQLAGIGAGRTHVEQGKETYSIPDTIGQMLGGNHDER